MRIRTDKIRVTWASMWIDAKELFEESLDFLAVTAVLVVIVVFTLVAMAWPLPTLAVTSCSIVGAVMTRWVRRYVEWGDR